MSSLVHSSLLVRTVVLLLLFYPSISLAQADCSNPDGVACTADYSPVCGSDGMTYPNECILQIAACSTSSLTVASQGECPEQSFENQGDDINGSFDGCSTACLATYAPVCGSNDITYANDCELEVAQCSNPSITKVSDGECP